MIPSTYVFMSLYSLINLNVINWGTREAVAKATGKSNQGSIANRLFRRVTQADGNSTLGRFLPQFKGNKASCEKIRALEQRLENTEHILLSIKVS